MTDGWIAWINEDNLNECLCFKRLQKDLYGGCSSGGRAVALVISGTIPSPFGLHVEVSLSKILNALCEWQIKLSSSSSSSSEAMFSVDYNNMCLSLVWVQVNEGHWHWGDHTVEVNSAFFTGIYGMWNLYVFAIMFLYAPSHKRYGDDQLSAQCITGNYMFLLTFWGHVNNVVNAVFIV